MHTDTYWINELDNFMGKLVTFIWTLLFLPKAITIKLYAGQKSVIYRDRTVKQTQIELIKVS